MRHASDTLAFPLVLWCSVVHSHRISIPPHHWGIGNNLRPTLFYPRDGVLDSFLSIGVLDSFHMCRGDSYRAPRDCLPPFSHRFLLRSSAPGGLMRSKRKQGHLAEPLPASAFGGSKKNLKNLQDLSRKRGAPFHHKGDREIIRGDGDSGAGADPGVGERVVRGAQRCGVSACRVLRGRDVRRRAPSYRACLFHEPPNLGLLKAAKPLF